jgi:peptidyl-prolyl cis-trans isomerase D
MRLSTQIWRGISARSILIGIVTFCAVAAFTVTGVTTSMQGLDANVAAKVGNQTVSLKSLQMAVQRQNRRENDEAARSAAIRTALDSMVQELVVVEEANRIGWGAADIEVADWIRKIPIFQDENSKSFDRKRYDNFVKSGQMSELELFQEGRQSIATQKYGTLLGLDTQIPAKLAEEYAKRTASSWKIEFMELAPANTAIEKAAKDRAASYLADSANTAALQKAYDERKAEFNRPAAPELSSILVAHKDAQLAQGEAKQRSKEDALKTAQNIVKQLNSKEDFAKLANTLSDDVKTKTTKNGGSLGFVDETSLDPASLAAGRALSANGNISEPVDTEFGYRILKRTGYREAVTRSFDDAKAELAESLVRPEVTAAQKKEVAGRVEGLLGSAQTAEFDKVTKELGLQWKPVAEPVNVETRFIQDLGQAEPVVQSLFTLRNPGDKISKVLSLSGKNFIVRLVERTNKPVDAAAIDAARDVQGSQTRSRFATDARRKLYDIYSENKEIRRNASLFAKAP